MCSSVVRLCDIFQLSEQTLYKHCTKTGPHAVQTHNTQDTMDASFHDNVQWLTPTVSSVIFDMQILTHSMLCS